MIYVLYGLETFLIEKEIEKIWQNSAIEPINISTYDMENASLKDILEDARMSSLFASNKGILVENTTFLTGSTKVEKMEDPSILEHYLKEPNPDTILIFTLQNEKLDERKKIVKELKKKAIVKAFTKKESNFEKIASDLLIGYDIKKEDIRLLIDRVGKDLHLLQQEIEKCKMYAYESKKLTKEDILALTSKNIEIDIFGLIDAIIAKRKEEAMETYTEMLKRSEEPIKIIIMLANQFRLMYQAKEMNKKGYTEGDIASELSVHPYRVKLALQKSRGYKSEDLLNYLDTLASLDENIKLGNLEKELALELFILGL